MYPRASSIDNIIIPVQSSLGNGWMYIGANDLKSDNIYSGLDVAQLELILTSSSSYKIHNSFLPSLSWSEINGKPTEYPPQSHVHNHISTNYNRTLSKNPQTYFGPSIGVKVAMMGNIACGDDWQCNDVLWINGYNAGDVPKCHALIFDRFSNRLFNSFQSTSSTTFENITEIWHAGNSNIATVDWKSKNTIAYSDVVAYYNDNSNTDTAINNINIAQLENILISQSSYKIHASFLPLSPWALATTKPAYAWSEITGKPTEYPPQSHVHSYISTNYNSSLSKNPQTYFGPSIGVKVAMMGNIACGDDWQLNDVLWINGYIGSDVPKCHALIFDRYSNRLFNSYQSTSSTTFQNITEIWHAGNSNIATVDWKSKNTIAYSDVVAYYNDNSNTDTAINNINIAQLENILISQSSYKIHASFLPLSPWALAINKPTYTWSEITGKPTEYPPQSHVHSHISTNYNSSSSKNPQTYFGPSIGVKVAMMGNIACGADWQCNDVLWINGYIGSDVPKCHALIFDRFSNRLFNSFQSTFSTTFENITEIWHSGNSNIATVDWKSKNTIAYSDVVAYYNDNSNTDTVINNINIAQLENILISQSSYKIHASFLPLSPWALATNKPAYAWSEITGKPTEYPPQSHVHSHISTNYNSSPSKNPQTYFGPSIGVKVAMMGNIACGADWQCNDVLWINGYIGSDVPKCHALIFDRFSNRLFNSFQSTSSTTFENITEIWHSGNSNIATVDWKSKNTIAYSDVVAYYNDNSNTNTVINNINIAQLESILISQSSYKVHASFLPLSPWALATNKPTYAWSEITGKPTEYPPQSHVHSYISTNYNSSLSKNPQTYFGRPIGIKVAMMGNIACGDDWQCNDVLWINGYNAGDVPKCHALIFDRFSNRLFNSYQSTSSTTFENITEIWHAGNSNSETKDWKCKNLKAAGDIIAFYSGA